MINVVRVYQDGRRDVLDRVRNRSVGKYYVEDWRRVLKDEVVEFSKFDNKSILVLSDGSKILME